ncbi:KilA-N domain-containing protein [uncultured Microbulbifer sp.]|uniref:KilA-N domain-containing protein n=1 Tax=uncultured Microbulbifer sp. TaxID=348147 RepID=UPI0026097094|nr:KilA-N domain-containing protein [uncultured Microbulbifer sp.]
MSHVKQLPIIAGVEITTDMEGRFNLNALHRAGQAGGHKSPSQWLRRDEMKALIAELESQSVNLHFGPINTIRGGSAPGTFAHELLAVEYAGWISPAFRLQVNQTFIDYRTGKLGTTRAAANDRWIFELAVDTLRPDDASKLTMLKKFGEQRNQDMQFLPDYSESQGVHHSLSELLRRHHSVLSARKANQILVDLGYLEVRSRQSKTKGTKRFKCITGKGARYGCNLVSPSNPNETQAHWYDSQFQQLLGELESVARVVQT